MFRPTLLIDFDETITAGRGYECAPNPDAVNALNKLKNNFKLVLYSCRANRDIHGLDEIELLKEYMAKYSIPYDEIHTRKPTFFALIDDRSINPKEIPWDSIVTKLLSDVIN